MDGDGQLVFLYIYIKKTHGNMTFIQPLLCPRSLPFAACTVRSTWKWVHDIYSFVFSVFLFLYIQRTDPEVIKADGENIVSRCFGTYTICMKKRDMGGSAKIEIK